jgi:hypothetical protein
MTRVAGLVVVLLALALGCVQPRALPKAGDEPGPPDLETVVPVTIVVNAVEIRRTRFAHDVEALLHAIPGWVALTQDLQGVVDPVRDTDWVLVSGPSLIHPSSDAIIWQASGSVLAAGAGSS